MIGKMVLLEIRKRENVFFSVWNWDSFRKNGFVGNYKENDRENEFDGKWNLE